MPLGKKADAGDYVKDFTKSKAPQFKGKSKKKRKEMAIAAYLSKKDEAKEPSKGTGKKPKGSSRRLYTDENPKDTVSVKFSSRQDIVDTLSKKSFKAKPHVRQSQIINLIHQRVRAAYGRAKNPTVKKRLKTALDYAEQRKEASKRKTQNMKKENIDPKSQAKHKGKSAPYGSAYELVKELVLKEIQLVKELNCKHGTYFCPHDKVYKCRKRPKNETVITADKLTVLSVIDGKRNLDNELLRKLFDDSVGTFYIYTNEEGEYENTKKISKQDAYKYVDYYNARLKGNSSIEEKLGAELGVLGIESELQFKLGELSADPSTFSSNEGVHDPMNPGILKKRLGTLSCSKVRAARGKLKDKGTTYAKALQRYLNYHCQ